MIDNVRPQVIAGSFTRLGRAPQGGRYLDYAGWGAGTLRSEALGRCLAPLHVVPECLVHGLGIGSQRQFYRRLISKADRRFDLHLERIEKQRR